MNTESPNLAAAVPSLTPERPEITSWPYEFPLTRVVQAHGEDTKVLVLEEPSGKDVFEFGLLRGLDPEQLGPLVSRLAKVPRSTLDRMAGADLMALSVKLFRFFNRAAA